VGVRHVDGCAFVAHIDDARTGKALQHRFDSRVRGGVAFALALGGLGLTAAARRRRGADVS
jgi:hypothetical protein